MMSKRSMTPVAMAPASPPKVVTRLKRSPLKAPIMVSTPQGEMDHERGELTLGRGDEAGILLDDPLVSRLHARLHVLTDQTIVIEDLESTNGVFVNGARLTLHTKQLFEGDSLLLGTTEVGLFSTRDSATMPIAPRVSQAHTVRPSGAPAPTARPIAVITTRRVAEPISSAPATPRAEVFELIDRLADRLLASGNQVEAVRVLSEHLHDVLLGTSAGLCVTTALLDHATRCALKLHGWTRKPSWLDYVLELHLACRVLPNAACLDALQAALPVTGLDAGLFNQLLSDLDAVMGNSSDDERERLARLRELRWR